ALIAVALVAVFRHSANPGSSAAGVLQKAAASEELIAGSRDHVLHRTLRLEEKSSSGQLISTHRIEVWQSAEKAITARRLYDQNDRLAAGIWLRGDGVQTLYRQGQPRFQIRNSQFAIRDFDDVWQLDPSAKEFRGLISNDTNASIEEADG